MATRAIQVSFFSLCIALASCQTLDLSWGTYTATKGKVVATDDLLSIKGLRYAAKPDRFKAAKALGKVEVVGETRTVCPQVPFANIQDPQMSEDCLTMDVYWPAAAPPAGAPRPIVVLFPELSFSSGGCRLVDLGPLAVNHGVTAICVQSRLGPFGYPVLPKEAGYDGTQDVPDSNLGLMDQDIALNFIAANRENLGHFANTSITLMGAGAGGAAVHHRLVKNDANVDRAIIFDGSLNNYYAMPAYYANKHMVKLAEELKCPKNDMENCLKEIQYRTLATKQDMFPWGPTWKMAKKDDRSNPLSGMTVKNVPIIVGQSARAGARDVILKNQGWYQLSAAQVAAAMDTQAKFNAAFAKQFPRVPVWNPHPIKANFLKPIQAHFYPFDEPGNGEKATENLIEAVSDYANSVNQLASTISQQNRKVNFLVFHQPTGAMNDQSFAGESFKAWANPTVGNVFAYMFGVDGATANTPVEKLNKGFKSMLESFFGVEGEVGKFETVDVPAYDHMNQTTFVLAPTGVPAATKGGFHVRGAQFWDTAAAELTTFPEPAVPEPEPDMTTMLVILVGIAVCVVIGTAIGCCVRNSHTRDLEKRQMLQDI